MCRDCLFEPAFCGRLFVGLRQSKCIDNTYYGGQLLKTDSIVSRPKRETHGFQMGVFVLPP